MRPRFTKTGHAFVPREERKAVAATRAFLAEQGFACDSNPLAASFLFFRADARDVDGDNLAKLALDFGQGILWRNDTQVKAFSVVVDVDRRAPRTVIGWARR